MMINNILIIFKVLYVKDDFCFFYIVFSYYSLFICNMVLLRLQDFYLVYVYQICCMGLFLFVEKY